MTDITEDQPRQDLTVIDRPRAQIATGGVVGGLVPQSLDEAYRLAQWCAKSGLTPRGIDTPEKCLYVIMAGADLKMPPAQALQSFALINGRLSIWGDAIPALLLSNGFKLREWRENDDPAYPDIMVAKCEIIRPDGQVFEGEFSVADAKEAKLWTKDGPWQTAKKRMMKMRARGFCARDGAADLLRGLFIAEEAQDFGPIPHEDQTAGTGMVARLEARAAARPTEVEPDGFNVRKVSDGAEEAKPKRAKKADKPVEAEPDQPQQQDGVEGGAEVVAEAVNETAPAVEAPIIEEAIITEPTPTVIAGPAPRGVRYTLASDAWVNNGKPSYLNGVVAGSAGRWSGLPDHEAHPEPAELVAQSPEGAVRAEDAPEATTQPETIERDALDALDDLSDAVPHMETWAEIKAAYLDIGRSEAWKKAQAYEQTAVKLTVYQAVIELVAAGKATVTPETDVTFFGIWLQYMTEKAPRPAAADEVQAALDKLTGSESFGFPTDVWKAALKAKTEATITMLRGA